MIAAAMALALAIGLAAGWVLTMVINSAAMPHSQERMERKVRYWQAATARARDQARAERQAGEAGVPFDTPYEGSGWPGTR